jgi:hypothetical protein
MAPVIGPFNVPSDHPVPVTLQGSSMTIKNVAGDTLYYGGDSTVSSTNNLGSLTSGNTASVSVNVWLKSASNSSVTIAPAGISEPGSSDIALGTDGTVGGPSGTALTAGVLQINSSGQIARVDGTGLTSAAITAFSGGGQASATALPALINRVTTTAASTPPYDSVKLPASATAGQYVIVVNTTNNPVQVFGAGTDTINGVASGTGITQPPNSVDTYVSTVAGSWFVEAGVGFSGQLFTELAQDSITAHAGGGQGSATQLTAQTSRITTVATAGDSVVLPASAPGLELMVINHGANPMQVFGLGSDKIDDVAAGTGVSQMANSLVIYTCATAGNWYSEGLATGFGGPGLQTQSTTSTITAHAGGGQGSATPLTTMINRVSTVASAGDSVVLPAFVLGLQIYVANAAATNSMNVFPATGDQINALGANAAFAVAAGKNATFTCTAANQWHAILSA